MLKIFTDKDPDKDLDAIISSDDSDDVGDSDDHSDSSDGLDEINLDSITEPEEFSDLELPIIPELFTEDPHTYGHETYIAETDITNSISHGDVILFQKNSHSVKFVSNEESYFKMMVMWLKGYRIFVDENEFVFIGTKVVNLALLDLSFLTEYSMITERSDRTIESIINSLQANS